MNVLGLFSGIGGFEYGLQQAGYNISAMCEIEPYPVTVLKHNFANIPIIDDVCNITAKTLDEYGLIDVIVGGFPCTDISKAGKRDGGINGKKSGLWYEFRRIIDEILDKEYQLSGSMFCKSYNDIMKELNYIGNVTQVWQSYNFIGWIIK